MIDLNQQAASREKCPLSTMWIDNDPLGLKRLNTPASSVFRCQLPAEINTINLQTTFCAYDIPARLTCTRSSLHLTRSCSDWLGSYSHPLELWSPAIRLHECRHRCVTIGADWFQVCRFYGHVQLRVATEQNLHAVGEGNHGQPAVVREQPRVCRVNVHPQISARYDSSTHTPAGGSCIRRSSAGHFGLKTYQATTIRL